MTKKGCRIPDEKWKWVVVFAAFWISLILAGIYRTFGVLLVAFIDEFRVTREEASLPLVICYSVINLTGIVVGPLGHRYGIRAVTITGSLLGAVGFSVCYFAPVLKVITFSLGFIVGFGFSLSYTLMSVIINQHFLNYRATVNGIVYSGACFGTIVYPPLYEHLIFTYELKGCLLLTGGIVLHIAISGALMKGPLLHGKPLDSIKRKRYGDIPLRCASNFEITEVIPLAENDAATETITEKNLDERNIIEDILNSEFENSSTNFQDDKIVCILEDNAQRQNQNPKIIKKFNSTKAELLSKTPSDKIYDIGSLSSTNKLCDSRKIFQKMNNVSMKQIQNSLDVSEDSKISLSEKKMFLPQNIEICNEKEKFNFHNSTLYESYDENATYSDKIVQPLRYTGTTKRNFVDDLQIIEDKNISNRLSLKKSSKVLKREKSLLSHPETVQSAVLIKSNDFTQNARKRNILETFKFVLSCPMFYVFAINKIAFIFNYQMFLLINVDYFLDRSVADTDTKYIIFAFSACDLIGRLSFGWITDRQFLRRSHLIMINMAGMALLFFSFPFAYGYSSLQLISSLYGLLFGCTVIVFNVTLLDYLVLEMQEVAFGCVSFLTGILTLVFIFLIGYFRDNLGSYSNIFFLLGVISLSASSLWLLESYFVKVKNCPGAVSYA